MALPAGKPLSKADLAGPLTDDDGINVIQNRVGSQASPKLRLSTLGALRVYLGAYLEALNNAALSGSQLFSEQRAQAALEAANLYTDSQFNQSTTLTDAKAYTDTKTNTIQAAAKTYTDDREAAIKQYVDTGDVNTLNAALAAIPDTSTFAPKNSPAFTGTPTAPTAPAATNTTQLATTAFVRAEVAALVNGSAANLDTLNELAAALGNDPNFATTISTQIGTKAPIDNPTFTGTVQAPTAEQDTNNNRVATTAFVLAQRGTVAPVMDGAASAGTSLRWSPVDHRHPTDTTRAPLDSPIFTGTPAAPTPTTGDNSTKLATTAFVQTTVSGLSGGGGSTNLDGLTDVQIAGSGGVALANGQSLRYDQAKGLFVNQAFTVGDISGAAPLDAPTFTGVPRAPTPTAGTNTTQLATCQFVQGAVNGIVNKDFDPKRYGAVADGTSRTVQSALGITTKAALAAYSLNGGTPYAWITGSVWKNHLNLDLSAAAASGATSLSFVSTAGVAVGNTVHGTGVAANTTVTALTVTTVTLSVGLTAAKAAGMTVSFQSPLSDADCAALQIDGLAAQSAIEAAKTAGGGTVDLGSGIYLINRALIIPERHEFSGQQVNIIGKGQYVTALRAASDLGAGKFVICCGDPSGAKGHLVGRYAINYYEGVCAEFRVEGPNRGAQTAGTAPCAMSGIGQGARRIWRNVLSWYFRNGMEVVGDHTDYHRLTLQYNYYGAYWADANPNLYGDFRFYDCFFMGNTFAGIGVSKNALINAEFIKPYFGGQPYHIVGEAGTADNYGQPFGGGIEVPIMQGCHVHLAQCEWAGNGSIVDLGGGADGTGTRNRSIADTIFFGGLWSWDTGKAIADRGQRYYFDVGAAEGMRFVNPSTDSFPVTAGQLAAFRVNAVAWVGDGLVFDGSMETILGRYDNGVPFLAPTIDRFAGGQWRNILFRDRGWEGRVGIASGTAQILKGTVMEAGGDFQGVRPATGGGNPLVGIVVCGLAAGGTSTDRLIIYATGENLKPRWGTGTNSPGQWLKTTTTGTVQPATGRTDGQVVGWSWHDNGGGTNSPSVRTIF